MSHNQKKGKAKKSLKTMEQIARARSGAAISATEADRFRAMAKGIGKAAPKRRKLPKSLISEKRGSMTKRGGMALGKGMGRKTGHKERGRIGLRSR